MNACKGSMFKIYLVWRVRKSSIKKESSVKTYWKVLELWIPAYFSPTYSLDTSKKEKAGIFVGDLAVLLNYYWIRN
ncbi:hypothetical protein Aspvir_006243 [Aspergillus viridinutans]|uniref:Uncharacterized protein n=1 Tax=Aspergillus viridinutans TaxID=75553 RepID=A0A9P3BTH1_ASPVI|nr:uncharacterized protein Aspvir_006243 [Aspergillus viridinutans]GIK02198.1 hypothetical protein Aspvir_006243 [Aspergillus viridinutans]